MKKVRLIILSLILASCSRHPGQFSPPEFLSVKATVNGAKAELVCEMSDSRADRCGFILDGQEISAELTGSRFSAIVDGLELDRTYSWSAFAVAGGSTVRSPEQTLSAPDGAVPIPDEGFRGYILDLYDANRDGSLSKQEASMIWKIELCSNTYGIRSLQGIGYMENLEELICYGEWADDMDLSRYAHHYISKHYHWDELYGPLGILESIDVSRNKKLRVLHLDNNSALGDVQGTIDLSGNPALEVLSIGMTFLAIPELTGQQASNITRLNITHLRGAIPDFTSMPKLRDLDISFEQTGRRVHVDVSNNPLLEELRSSGTVQTLSDLSHNPNLWHLHAAYLEQETLDVSSNPKLREMYVPESEYLHTLYVAPGQRIPGVTENRSSAHVPEQTQIVEK